MPNCRLVVAGIWSRGAGAGPSAELDHTDTRSKAVHRARPWCHAGPPSAGSLSLEQGRKRTGSSVPKSWSRGQGPGRRAGEIAGPWVQTRRSGGRQHWARWLLVCSGSSARYVHALLQATTRVMIAGRWRWVRRLAVAVANLLGCSLRACAAALRCCG
jgi:hypothetical protein